MKMFTNCLQLQLPQQVERLLFFKSQKTKTEHRNSDVRFQFLLFVYCIANYENVGLLRFLKILKNSSRGDYI